MDKEAVKLDVLNRLKSRGLKDRTPMNVDQVSEIISEYIIERERSLVGEVMIYEDSTFLDDPDMLNALVDEFYEEREARK